MKKLGTVVAALVMCLAMATTAFAASPVKVQSATPGVTVVENAEVQAAVQAKLSTPEQLKAALGDSYKEGAAVLAIFELEGTAGKVTLNVAGINAGDTLKVIHFNDDLSVKEVLDATAENGKVTFTTASFSPFAIVRVAAAAGNGAASPKTGEAGATAAMAVIALSAAGIVVLNRKKVA